MQQFRYNGTVQLNNFAEYIDWYKSLAYNDAKEVQKAAHEWLEDFLPPSYAKDENITKEQRTIRRVRDTINAFFDTKFYCNYKDMNKEYAPIREKSVRLMTSLQAFATDFEQPVYVVFWSETYALIYVGNSEKCIPVVEPGKYLTYTPEKDFSEVTPAQMQTALCAQMDSSIDRLIPAGTEASMTVKQAKSALTEHQEALDDHKKRMEDTERCESPELIELKNQIEALKQEMYKKRDALMADLEEKLYEMEETKFRLEGQIYLLDSQIYSMLCYAGETIKFAKLRSGKNAPDTEPVVIHQKLHFLDETLGRLASLYMIHWGQIDQFETFLKYHPLALETFAPNERCVSLVRLSRTNRRMGFGSDQYGAYNNIMEHYEYFHGKTVGIIIRNGENLYLGWTEEDRVDIADDLIISRIITEVTPAKEEKFLFESDRREHIKKQRQEQKKVIDGVVSRSFVYSILQGVVDNTSMLPLPKGIKLNKQSEYVIYSLADKWLGDNKFGTLKDIVAAANKSVSVGDTILTTQYLVPERNTGWSSPHYYDPRWNNTRGRGAKNRTHDCHVEDCKIYPVNVVEFDRCYYEAKYTEDGGRTFTVATPYYHKLYSREALDNYMQENYPKISDYTVNEIRGDRHVFVSVQKQGFNYSTGENTTARSNFELYENEYINLDNLSSAQLKYAITNRNATEGYYIGGKEADYAFLIRYLKTAKEYVDSREAAEKRLIDAIDPSICFKDTWVLDILEFKKEKNVRKFSETWAKRFVKWTKERATEKEGGNSL